MEDWMVEGWRAEGWKVEGLGLHRCGKLGREQQIIIVVVTARGGM